MNKALKLMLPLLAAAALAACGQDAADTAAEKLAKQHGIDVDINRDGDEATYTLGGADGQKLQVGENLGVPDGFPKDIPVYPGLKIVAASTTPEGFVVHAQSTDGIEKIAAFYNEKLGADGWTKDGEFTQAEAMRTASFKKDNRTAGINLFSAGDGTVTVQLSALSAAK